MFSNQNTFELNLSNLENKIKAYEEEIVQLKQQLEQTQSQLESWWLRCKIHRIPFMEISQVKKAKRQDWEKNLFGFGLSTPKEGELWDTETLEFKGWILGKDAPVDALEVSFNHKPLCQVPVDQLRPHIAEKFKDIAYADNCGFEFKLSSKQILLDESCLEIEVILENTQKLKIFEIHLKQRLTQSSSENVKSQKISLIVTNYLQKNSDLFLMNKDYEFAIKQHLCCESKKFLYCFIPKNACTTFKTVTAKYSIFSSEDELEKASKIHSHTNQLKPKVTELINESYFKFIIVRNPFLRLISAYLNKLVIKDRNNLENFGQDFKIMNESRLMTFQDFIQYVEKTPSQQLNVHWRPQVDFLLYNSYNMYLQFENLKQDIPKLEKALDIKIPKQNVAKNTTPYAYLDVGEPWKLHGEELWQIRKSQNVVPLPYQMYNDELIAKVHERYQQDIELYENLFEVSAEAMLRPSS